MLVVFWLFQNFSHLFTSPVNNLALPDDIPGHIPKKAQNVPLQQSISSVVSFNLPYSPQWCATLATPLDMNNEFCFLFIAP